MNGVTANFQPQAWQNDYAIDIDGAFEFDATAAVMRLSVEEIKKLKDDSYEADNIAQDAGAGEDFSGPFFVTIVEPIEKFLEQFDTNIKMLTKERWAEIQAQFPEKESKCTLMSCDDFEAAILRIDWKKREYVIEGAGGHRDDLMTPEQVRQELMAKPVTKDIEKVAVVAWKENADGYTQICFYDLKAFESEVYGPASPVTRGTKHASADRQRKNLHGKNKGVRTQKPKRVARRGK